jgi:hypothetical protein
MLKLLQTSVALVLGALALPALGQAQTPGQPAQRKTPPQAWQNPKLIPIDPVPDHIIYLSFFQLLRSFDNWGHRDYVAGHPERSDAWHSYVKWDARLTARENEVLKAVATDCLEEADAITNAWRASHPGLKLPLDEATTKDLHVEKEKWARVILDHVEQLKTAFGPKRFPVLDRYVRYRGRNIKVFSDETEAQN